MDASEALDRLPRLKLCRLPTPVRRLGRLERELGCAGGPELYVKRDDLTGVGLGGNKGRKLEFLLAEARGQGAEVILMSGGPQSNCCRQVALAGGALGLDVHIFYRGDRPGRFTGNLIPTALGGAHMHFTGVQSSEEIKPKVARFAEELRAAGRRPYVIPPGGSNAVGTLGYVAGAREIAGQGREMDLAFDWIFFPSGSGGTQAGLELGGRLFGLGARMMGMCVRAPRDEAGRREMISGYAAGAAGLMGVEAEVSPEELFVISEYAGAGYGVPTEEGRAAQKLLARTEGLLLDNTYTAKAMSGLIDCVKTGEIKPGEKVLFIHTGGQIGMFA